MIIYYSPWYLPTQITWDTKQIAEEMPGFQFVGPGWYSKEGTWMLIVPTSLQDVYILQVFFDRDPRPGFQALSELLVRNLPKEEKESEPLHYGGLIVLLVAMVIIIPLIGFASKKLGLGVIPILFALVIIWTSILRWIRKRNMENKT